MKKSIFTFFLIATLVLVLTACAGGTSTSGDHAGDNRPTTTAPATQPTATAPQTHKITTVKAENIALKHAGLNRENARIDRTELEYDDGIWKYEIEIHAADWELDYEIHAETGEILRCEKEKEKKATQPDPKSTEPAGVEQIAATEAEDIALNHAGLTRDAVRFDRTELDRDDGRWEYEIEFYADGWEYSYEIHAETGKILSYDKEIWD